MKLVLMTNKISLSCFDDKRYVLDDGINTLAYFHKNIDINRECWFYLVSS